MRDSTIFYRSFYEALKELPAQNQSEVYTAIFEYSLNFNEVELQGISKTVFTLIKPQIDANIKRYKSGITPKEKQPISETEAKPKRKISETEANANKNVNDNVNHNENVNEIVNYLNSVCSSNFKTSNRITHSKINARIKEGYSVDDFKKVIDIKFKDWASDAKMKTYLRPDTLFGTKFESYLNQSTAQRTSPPREPKPFTPPINEW